ncbi:MAG: transglutaminaseTgpA domain-containing protein [Planctomycetota bacterium]
MNDRLHPLLVALALIDLAFVQATDAVASASLAPLWVFTLASIRLRRLQRFRSYRIIWNGAVLIVFSLLVHHATTTGLLHMLEDGLILSVLCQVHLINNIGDKQRPDLTFFNSFLIAFVTSFFASNALWSILFVAHAFVFVPALQVYALTARDQAVDSRIWRATLRDSLPRTLAIAFATALAFAFWPRDFERKGWLASQMAFGQQLQVGLSQRIELEQNAPTRLSNAIVMRIEPQGSQLSSVPTHWRSSVFSRFDGSTWLPQQAADLGSRFASDSQWQRQADGTWRRAARGAPHTTLQVQQFDASSGTMLLPMQAVNMRPKELGGRLLNPKSYAGFHTVLLDAETATALRYEVDLAQPKPTHALTPAAVTHFASLPEQSMPQLARDMSARFRAQYPKDVDALTYAHALTAWLQSNRRYQLPGQPGFARNLGEFLLGSAAGHCEYFATTLALLLRCEGIPCRLVGGYLVQEPSEDGLAMIARERNAHAWVEMLSSDGTWHTFDATPSAELDSQTSGASWWDSVNGSLQTLWAKISGFDGKGRSELLQSLATLPIRRPLGTAAAALTIALAVCWRRQRRRRTMRGQSESSIVRLQRALQRLQLELRPGETPREILRRLPAETEPSLAAELREAAAAHERQRYRPNSTY